MKAKLAILVCVALVAGTPVGKPQKGGQKRNLPKKEPKYFTPEWKKLFSEKQLAKQPKWFLTKGQPADGTYQLRRYVRHWAARSWESCRTGQEALQAGYLDLYLYFNGQNFQKKSYGLTYPVVVAVNSRPAATPKSNKKPEPSVEPTESTTVTTTPEPCLTRYITQFYIPIPLTNPTALQTSKTVKTFKRAGDFYVREYQGNTTSTEKCEEQATQFAADLTNKGKIYLNDYFVCAHYPSPANSGDSNPKLEVWMKKIKQSL